MFVHLLPSLRMLIVMSVVTGVVYPLVVTGIAQVAFPAAANGSLISVNGKAMGSSLIGQPFDDPNYFWSRPSATSPQPYNAMASSGSTSVSLVDNSVWMASINSQDSFGVSATARTASSTRV